MTKNAEKRSNFSSLLILKKMHIALTKSLTFLDFSLTFLPHTPPHPILKKTQNYTPMQEDDVCVISGLGPRHPHPDHDDVISCPCAPAAPNKKTKRLVKIVIFCISNEYL